eukprot:1162074-Pelagomonas_calceolata.AAC.3
MEAYLIKCGVMKVDASGNVEEDKTDGDSGFYRMLVYVHRVTKKAEAAAKGLVEGCVLGGGPGQSRSVQIQTQEDSKVQGPSKGQRGTCGGNQAKHKSQHGGFGCKQAKHGVFRSVQAKYGTFGGTYRPSVA